MMDYDTDDHKMLDGSAFSTGYRFRYRHAGMRTKNRIKLLLELCGEGSVIHVGCADHQPVIEAKIAAGRWLHKRLTDSRERCVGIDVDRDAVDFIRNGLGITNVHYADILAGDLPAALEGQWDYLLLGEMLEHTDDPVRFLSRIRETFAGRVRRCIITVPNAFWLNNFIYATRHCEFVNSDHRYWFTPYSLSKVTARAGMQPEDLYACMNGGLRSHPRWKRYLLRRFPLVRETLVAVASLERPGGQGNAV